MNKMAGDVARTCPVCGVSGFCAEQPCSGCQCIGAAADVQRLDELCVVNGQLQQSLWDLTVRKEAVIAEWQTIVAKLEATRSLSEQTNTPHQYSSATQNSSYDFEPTAILRNFSKWTPKRIQNMLLLLGAFFCGLAAILFLFVSWGSLSFDQRALVIGAMTLAVLALSRILQKRDLSISAEIVSAIGMLLMVLDAWSIRKLDVDAVSSLDAWKYWSIASAMIGVLLFAYWMYSRLIAIGVVALFALQIPLFCVLIGIANAYSTAFTATLVGIQLILVAFIARRMADVLTLGTITRGCVVATAAFLALYATLAAFSDLQLASFAAIAAAFSIAAAGVIIGKRSHNWIATAATFAMTLLTVGLLNSFLHRRDVYTLGFWFACAGLLLVVFHAIGERVFVGRLRISVRLYVAIAALVVVYPVAVVFLSPNGWWYDVWTQQVDVPAIHTRAQLLPRSEYGGAIFDGNWFVIGTLLLLASALRISEARTRFARPSAVFAIFAVASAVALLPFVERFSLSATNLLLVAMLTAAIFRSARTTSQLFRTTWLVVALLFFVQAFGIAAAAESITLATFLWCFLLAVFLALAIPILQTVGGVAATVLGPTTFAIVVAAVDGSMEQVTFAYVFAATIAMVAVAWLKPRNARFAIPLSVAYLQLAFAFVVLSYASTSDLGYFSHAVATISIGLMLTARVLRSRTIGWLAAVGVLCFVWNQLFSNAQVDVLESYTMPLACLALFYGLSWMRRHSSWNSWQTLAPALLIAFVPTLFAVIDDQGLTRAILLAIASLFTLIFGINRKLRAPVVIGSGTLLVLALLQLAPYAVQAPRWIGVALVGAILLTLGVTWERRRQHLEVIRERFLDFK